MWGGGVKGGRGIDPLSSCEHLILHRVMEEIQRLGGNTHLEDIVHRLSLVYKQPETS